MPVTMIGPAPAIRAPLTAFIPTPPATGLSGFAQEAFIHENQLPVIPEDMPWAPATLPERSPEAVPGHDGPLAWRVEATSRFMAHGEAVIVEAWPSLPAPRERHLFVSAATALLPPLLIPRPH
ncbi:hypothetical protein ABT025_39075 [Streptomyces sp. NPDC002809]|uniref:hypothetical protein n=1 Tax=Streptomyces sp. NPDC002809 TaxID=3154433 RepID=UPI0033236002